MTSLDWTAVGAVDYAAATQLGLQAHAAGRLQEAALWYRRALAFRPGAADVYNNLAVALMTAEDYDGAADAYRGALAVRPRYARAHVGLSVLNSHLKRNREALKHFRAALEIDPNQPNVRFNMGTAYQSIGMAAEAAVAFRESLPDIAEKEQAWSQYLLCLNYLGDMSPEAVFAEHQRYGARFPAPSSSHANDPTPERRLRIGYLTVEFRRHLGAYFLKPLLRRHDRSQFEIFNYCALPPGGYDVHTQWFKQNCDHWVDVSALSDDALEARIRADGVDVLVDLAGHSGLNRLPVLARKPAPTQITWLGYANTTGLQSFDARLVSDASDPAPQADRLASEPLLRMPSSFLAFDPVEGAPPVTPPPLWTTGRVTFGSFNYLGKITPQTAAVWSEILLRVPDSRLLLKDRALDSQEVREEIVGRFIRHGVAADRIDCVGFVADPADHLKMYAEVDVALDPFPYNGTITSVDTLWMGVPLISLRGDRHAARVGAMLLEAAGLGELIGEDRADYVDKAAALAQDLPRLAFLRAGQRDRLRASPLCDADGFARRLETVYRDVWRRWCAERGGRS